MSGFWSSPASWPFRSIAFLGWFIGQFVLTSLQVVFLIMVPGRRPKPAIVSIDMGELSDTELTILIALITITPDTLVIAVDRENKKMFVHGMFVDGKPEAFRDALIGTRDRLVFGMRFRPGLHSKTRGES